VTALKEKLLRRIAAEGPISVAAFMTQALLDPQDGYYRVKQPLGRAGDFVTAPEISQMFGEVLGIWCLDAWLKLGRPKPLQLIELGPGRGSLMSDALRSLRQMPEILEGLSIHLVEVSPALQAVQREALGKEGVPLSWYESLEAVPEGPALVLANEFFDALPIRQYEKTPAGWRERLVTAAGEDLAFALSGPLPGPLIPAEGAAAAPPGAVVEIAAAGEPIVREIARRCLAGTGAALIIDYGYDQAPWKGSLQAVKDHKPVELLETPGAADLSAHVDFAGLARAARAAGALALGPVPQGTLLTAAGIGLRAEKLAADKDLATAQAIVAAHDRLIGPDAMGDLFKALAICPPGIDIPAGFPTSID